MPGCAKIYIEPVLGVGLDIGEVPFLSLVANPDPHFAARLPFPRCSRFPYTISRE